NVVLLLYIFINISLFSLFSCLVKLNGGRHVQGILRGFDPFMNLVVDDCLEMSPGGQQNTIGMVVIRGNSIIMLEALERV
uniref:Small nuclear ribonucleoprotein G n=1 Tax=Astyanax mexicanus TaxID=7994 RepID=A0A8B9H6A0_ASTMX